MHIVLLSPSWPLGFANGIVTYTHYLRVGLQQSGHRVSILTLGGQVDEAQDVYTIAPAWLSRVKSRVRRALGLSEEDRDLVARSIADSVLRIHKRHPVDVLEMEESFGWCEGVQRHLPMPVVVKLHGPAFLSLVEEDARRPQSLAKIEAERVALRNCSYVTSPSRDTLDRTRRHIEGPDTWGRVIGNPLVLDDATPRWTLDGRDPHALLFVGRFDKRKGGDLVVQAFARLLEQRPGLKLVFAGPDNGVEVAGLGRLQLEDFARLELKDGLRERLVVMGSQPPDVVAQLRCQAAVTLVCSRWDNQPNTALEALYQGCPVVGIDSGGVSEVIQHGVTGLLAPSGDLGDFCRQVLWMLDHPTEAAALGLAGRAYVKRAHDIGAIAAMTGAYYAEVCATHAKRTRRS